MKVLKKLVTFLILIVVVENSSIFAMDFRSSKKRKQPSEDQEVKIESESQIKQDIIAGINACRSMYLEKHLPKVLSDIVQEYDPIKDEWICEKTFGIDDDFISKVFILSENEIAYIVGRTIKIWNSETEKCELSLEFNGISALSPLSGNKLAVGSGNSVIILNWKTGNSELILKREKCAYPNDQLVQGLCYLSSNKLVVSYCDGMKLWNLHTGKCEKNFFSSPTFCNQICKLPNNKLAIVIINEKNKTELKIYNLDTEKWEESLTPTFLRQHGFFIFALDKILVSGFLGTFEIKVWDLETLKFIKSINTPEQLYGVNCYGTVNKLIICGTGQMAILDLDSEKYDTISIKNITPASAHQSIKTAVLDNKLILNIWGSGKMHICYNPKQISDIYHEKLINKFKNVK